MSHVTCHMSRVTCHVSHVTCHMSRVTCHMSRVTCHNFFLSFFFFGQSVEAYRWRVCYQQGLPRLVFTWTWNQGPPCSGDTYIWLQYCRLSCSVYWKVIMVYNFFSECLFHSPLPYLIVYFINEWRPGTSDIESVNVLNSVTLQGGSDSEIPYKTTSSVFPAILSDLWTGTYPRLSPDKSIKILT